MKNRFIDVNGFEPSQEDSQFMQLKLDQILGEAPARASISVKLDKKGSIFESTAHIFFGPSEPLTAMATGTDLKEMVLVLAHNMRVEIKKWRNERFSEAKVDPAV